MNLVRASVLKRRWIVAALAVWVLLILLGVAGFHALDLLLASMAWFAFSMVMRYHAWADGYRARRDEQR